MRGSSFLALLLAGAPLLAADSGPWQQFDADAAYEHVRVLAEEIGPRPTGSPGEKKAFAYVRRVLEGYGYEVRELAVGWVELDDVHVRVDSSQLVASRAGTDPNRGALLLSGHVDSRDGDCPGANDDAAGVAVTLEAARVLAREPLPNETRFLFTTGEELGLLGARAYVAAESTEGIELALTLDPAGYGEMFVAPFPAGPELWANRLFGAAATRAGASRAVHDPAYVVLPRLLRLPYGADHMPFLDAGVPAMNLSNRLRTWNYHTSEDTLAQIEKPTLLTAGATALALLQIASESPVQRRQDPRYVLLSLPFGGPLYLSGWVLLALCPLGAAAGLYASFRVLRTGWACVLPVLLMWLLAGMAAFLPEAALSVLHGYRFPWWSAPGRVLFACLLSGLLAAGLLARVARRLPFRVYDPKGAAAYAASAAGLAALGAAVLFFASGRDTSFYLAWPALLWGGWAVLLDEEACPGHLRFLAHVFLLAIGAGPLFVLVRPLVYMQLVELLGAGFDPAPGLIGLVILAACTPAGLFLAALPAFAPLRFGPRTLGALGAGVVFLTLALWSVPPYGEDHPRLVRLHQRFASGGEPSEVRILSFDRLRRLRAGTTRIDSHELRETLEGPAMEPVDVRFDWTPLEPGAARLSVSLETDVPARWLGVRLDGERFSLDPLEVRDRSQYRIVAAGQKKRFEWTGTVRGASGTELRVTPYGWWDANLIGWELEGEDAVWDAVATLRGDYEQKLYRIP